MSYELDQLLGTYADWIAWLKEKEANLEGQLARMRGKPDGRPETGDGSPPPAACEDSLDTPSDEVRPAIETPSEDAPPSPVPRPPSVAESDNDDDWL
jgi:hypothetical protein